MDSRCESVPDLLICSFEDFIRNHRALHNGLVLLLATCLFEPFVTGAQEPAEKSAAPASIVRPCSAPPARKNKPKARGATKAEDFAFACLEAKGSSLELLEFFQSYVREQSWAITDERIIEDGWIFSRSLNKEELLQFAKEGPFAGRVNWTEGKAVVQVVTRELDRGFTRVEISTHLQGNGQSVDRFAPPKESWELDSSGALEKLLIDALDTHQKSLHSSPSSNSSN